MRNKSNKVLALFLVLAMSLGILSGCGGGSQSEGEGGKDVLKVAVAAEAKSLDPHATNDAPSASAMKQIYEGLVSLNEKFEVKPCLAESWTQIDDLTYEFKLRKGVKFHNGEELKASDVKFTFERASKATVIANIVGEIDPEGTKIIDDYTVQLKTKHPYAPLLASLGHPGGFILNEKAVTEAGDNYAQNPIGTGPYKFVKWDKGNQIQFTRNDDYYGNKAKIKDITIRIIPESTNRTIELESGGVDIAYDIPTSDLDRVNENKDLKLLTTQDVSTIYFGFNVKKKPFDNIKLRQAISKAIDINSIVNSVFMGSGKAAKGPLGPSIVCFNPNLKEHEYNVEKARQLMKEAGLESGFQTIIWVSDSKDRIDIATIVQSQLKEIKIDAEIKVLEWATYLDTLGKGEAGMFIQSWNDTTAQPDAGLYGPFHTAKSYAGSNRTGYSNPKVDELLELGRKTFDDEQSKKIYYEVQEIVMNDTPWIPIYHGRIAIGTSKNVEGFVPIPNKHQPLFNTYFSETK